MTRNNIYNFAFTHTPMKNEMHLHRIYSTPQLQEALYNNMTELFLRDLIWRLDNEKNYNILIEGEQGSGKSTIAREIKAYTDKYKKLTPTIKDICFDRKEFLERFKSSLRYETIIIDEDYTYRTQLGSMRVSEQFEFIEQAIRIEQTNIISCAIAPTPHLFNYRLEAFDIEYQLELNRAVVYDNQSKWSAKPVGFILLPKSLLYPQIESDYTKRKVEFANLVKKAKQRKVFEELTEKRDIILKKYGSQGRLKRAIITLLCRKEFSELGESELDELNNMIFYQQDVDRLIKAANDEELKEKQSNSSKKSVEQKPILKKKVK